MHSRFNTLRNSMPKLLNLWSIDVNSEKPLTYTLFQSRCIEFLINYKQQITDQTRDKTRMIFNLDTNLQFLRKQNIQAAECELSQIMPIKTYIFCHKLSIL